MRPLSILFLLWAVLAGQVIWAENVINIDSPSNAVTQMKKNNTRYVISCMIDLKSKRLTVPSGCTLDFRQGGGIINGYLTGNKTRIEGETEGIFRYTSISGSFNVARISTDMFQELTYENALCDVFGLTSNTVQNTVTIEPLPDGKSYNVSTSDGANIIRVPSNTDVIINGKIQMAPCNLESYSIFQASQAENVSFTGNGIIIGDRATHTGTKGEWGMGINVVGSKNVHISGLTISDCWGDCIYIGRSSGKQSQDVTIDKCLLTGSRRQGVSVVACYNSTLSNLDIRDIYGTDPQSAIDVEPNSGDTCTGVWIHHVKVRNCYHGIISTTPGDAVSKITDIHIDSCDIESEVLGLSTSNCDLFEVKNTHVLTEYSALRSHISTVKIDSCFFGPYEGKELESDIIVLWDVILDVRNSEFHGTKFLDNPKATPASKRMSVVNNKIFCPVELKMQSGQVIGNTVCASQAPLMQFILGEGNTIRNNTLIYSGEDQPANLLDIQTAGNVVENNQLEYRPTGILSPHVRLTPPDTGVYTLDGRLIQHPTTAASSRLPRGIYIINHRKVAVK